MVSAQSVATRGAADPDRCNSRLKQDAAAQKALSQTVKLAEMKSQDFDTIFYVGGHALAAV